MRLLKSIEQVVFRSLRRLRFRHCQRRRLLLLHVSLVLWAKQMQLNLVRFSSFVAALSVSFDSISHCQVWWSVFPLEPVIQHAVIRNPKFLDPICWCNNINVFRDSNVQATVFLGSHPAGSFLDLRARKSRNYCPPHNYHMRLLSSIVNSYELAHTIGNSRITFHHFIFRELFLVIISSWLTSKNLAELFLVICRIYISGLTSHNIRNHYIGKFWANYFS